MIRRKAGSASAPKFPRPVTLNFLFRFYARDPRANPANRRSRWRCSPCARWRPAECTIISGGGFHRYSVDRFWHVPHFEKMLYDQAQLAVAYLDAFQITREPQYRSGRARHSRLCRSRHDRAGRRFLSAEDADSLCSGGHDRRAINAANVAGASAHAEGAFYVWTKKEIDAALGYAAEIFDSHYGVEPHGNAPAGSDPHDEFRGKNILIQRHTIAETAQHFKNSEDEIRQSLARSREISLLFARNGRVLISTTRSSLRGTG